MRITSLGHLNFLDVNKFMRNSNIELLRLVLLLMVCIIHSTCNQLIIDTYGGGERENLNLLPFFFYILSRPAVDCFVLITGYFCISKQFPRIIKFSDKKKVLIPALWCIPIIGIYIVIFHLNKGPLKAIAYTTYSLFAIRDLFDHLWYIIGYLWILFLAPFINKSVNTITQKEYKNLIIVASFVFVFLSSINDFFGIQVIYGYTFNSYSEQKSYNIILFIILYLIGGYVCKYNIKTRAPFLKFLLISIIVAFFGYMYSLKGGPIIILKQLFGYNPMNELKLYEAFFKYNNIFIILMAYYLFMGFNQLKFRLTIINKFARHTYTAYLLHIVIISMLYYLICSFFNIEAQYPFYTVKSLPPITHIVIGLLSAIISLLLAYGIEKLIKLCQRN